MKDFNGRAAGKVKFKIAIQEGGGDSIESHSTAHPRANSFQIDRKERLKEEIILRILHK